MFSLYLQASKAYNEISYQYELIANNPGIVSRDRANLVKEALFQAELLKYKVWLKLMEQQVTDSNKYATIS
jgi:hypothetical protein